MPTKEAYLIVKAAVSDMVDGFENHPDRRKCKQLKKRMEKSMIKNSGYTLIPYLNIVGKFESPSTGFVAQVYYQNNTEYQNLTINGKAIISNHGTFTEIHFAPEGRESVDHKKITDSLFKGLEGVMELLEAINQKKFRATSIFIGSTNIRMALATQRLGFVLTDQCYNSNGEINEALKEFKIIGNLNEIKKRIEEIKESNINSKLEQRNQRLKLEPVV